MLPRSQRLPYSDAVFLQKNGKVFSSPLVSITLGSAQQETTRVLIIVPNSAAKNIVQRNRIQRMIRARVQNNLPLFTSHNVLVRVHARPESTPQDVIQHLTALFQEIKKYYGT